MSVEFYRGSPGKFDSRTLGRKALSRWTGRITLALQAPRPEDEAVPQGGPSSGGAPRIIQIMIRRRIIMIISVCITIIISDIYIYIYIYMCLREARRGARRRRRSRPSPAGSPKARPRTARARAALERPPPRTDR